MQIGGILESCLYVNDLDAAQQFYINVLGLRLVERHPTRHLFAQCGRHMLLIFDPDASDRENSFLPPHGAKGAGHIAFAVTDREIGRWRTHLENHGIEIEKEIEWPQGGHSIYFRDPAGNSVELASPLIWHIEETLFEPKLGNL